MRVRDESIGGENPFRWERKTTKDLFGGKRIAIFSLPGAFTPTCSASHLPGFEAKHTEITSMGIDEIYCVSVNDAFVMYQWGLKQGAKNVKLLPDGNGDFTRKMGMLVDKANIGFGLRSWRYSLIARDCTVEKSFIEDGFRDLADSDPFEVSDADTMLKYLRSR